MTKQGWTSVKQLLVALCAISLLIIGVQAAGSRPAQDTPSLLVTTDSGVAQTVSTTTSLASFSHVYVIVMENKAYSQIIGNTSEAPYINSLAGKYALATNYFAIRHPSLPNYLALWSGSTQGVTDDHTYNFSSGSTLADQLENAGKSWHVAAQNVKLPCFTGSTATGGEDGTSGGYARRHEPAISWTSVSGNASRCARITDFTHFDPTLGKFWFIVPNVCNDMHDCSIRTGDNFLKSFIPTITSSPAFTNSVLFLTWDEGEGSLGGGGQVATLAISPLARTGFRSATAHTHYSLLHTIQNAWGLPCLINTCPANDLRELFK